ncbi:MAG TPA: glycosyltransferase family 2 protein [Spirochaetota bacterium]|nr:MAG: N-glycosyltransferase [Spirochaetes bacterium ADurb.Bin218]HON16454.1 glycosyltransferase family 2 protein [Spirochaetota bacterium]HOV07707.1 glycosyltransferase family 2 protein [Spirochaetota bacterium]
MSQEYRYEKWRIGKATELTGIDYLRYRFWEILPGAFSWATIIIAVVASYFWPFYAAVFIIAFDVFWLLKTAYLSIHLKENWKRLKEHMNTDWVEKLKNFKYEHIYHMIMLPFYKEDESIVEKTLLALLESEYNPKKFIVVLAAEERAGQEPLVIASNMKKKYGKRFGHFLVTVHPDGIEGEIAGKGSNIAYAAERARIEILDKYKIPYHEVLVSAFDIDTIVYKQYFACLTWMFLANEKPYNTSFQPVPVFNNNIFEAPAVSRVVAFSGTFWQMVQQERQKRLATFSSHSIPFSTLYAVGYWQSNMVSEDSRIFWNCYMKFNGDYIVTPMSYPISMDANLAPTFWQTMKNIYKQQRRWAYGVENFAYIMFNFSKNKIISPLEKLRIFLINLDGYWSLATNPILIFILGWMPIVLGGREFNTTVLSFNLPYITRDIMMITMSNLILSSMVAVSLMPSIPENTKKTKKIYHIVQWLLVPVTITVFGAIPALDAQTRLMFGKYMGFWVTPKHRSMEG